MSTTAVPQTAAYNYAFRPDDERFESLAALRAHSAQVRSECHEARYNLRDLNATTHPQNGIILESPNGQAAFTHYSFAQLCKSIDAPAHYLRDLEPGIACQAINDGLHRIAPVGERANILIRDNGDETQLPIARACTTETYSRLWDETLYGEIDRHFGDGQRSISGGEWQNPPVWPGAKPGGIYAGDRDSFVIRIDGGSIVTDPRSRTQTGGGGGKLFRGLMISNSETGHKSVTVDCIMLDFICGNHLLWGAVMDRTFRRRHVGQITKDTIAEIVTVAKRWNDRTASQDEQIITSLVSHELAHTKDAVIDELKKIGYTKKQAEEAYATTVESESAFSPRSFWGLAAGTTRMSQATGYQDERLKLDTLAANILKRGIKQLKLVA